MQRQPQEHTGDAAEGRLLHGREGRLGLPSPGRGRPRELRGVGILLLVHGDAIFNLIVTSSTENDRVFRPLSEGERFLESLHDPSPNESPSGSSTHVAHVQADDSDDLPRVNVEETARIQGMLMPAECHHDLPEALL